MRCRFLAFALAPWLASCTGVLNEEWSVLPPEEQRRPPAVLDANAKLAEATRTGDVTIVPLLEDGKRSTTLLIRVTGSGKVPAHFHARSAESWYILRGGGDLLLDQTWAKVRAGMLVHIPLGVPHAFVNRDPEGTLILDTFAPGFIEGDRVWLEEGSPADTP